MLLGSGRAKRERTSGPPSANGVWDTGYEWRAIVLLSLGFGLVALDRFLILPLFPVIMKDLNLDYADLGNITGALAITCVSVVWRPPVYEFNRFA